MASISWERAETAPSSSWPPMANGGRRQGQPPPGREDQDQGRGPGRRRRVRPARGQRHGRLAGEDRRRPARQTRCGRADAGPRNVLPDARRLPRRLQGGSQRRGGGDADELRHIGKRLFAFFGKDRRLNDIAPGEVDRFADHFGGEYEQATAAKTIKMARQFFRRAVRLRLIAENPFDGVKAGTEQNRGRSFFVAPEAADRSSTPALTTNGGCWSLLARYGGLRTPSESFSLAWSDVLWDQDRFRVRSPKTERQGKPESAGAPLP